MDRVRLELTALFLVVVSACTSVTQVAITPDQVRAIAWLSPDKERHIVVEKTGEIFDVNGENEVRLLVRPGDFPGEKGRPWVRLCDLRWYPLTKSPPTDTTGIWLYPDDQIGLSFYPVRASDLAGADVKVRVPNGWLTAALVGGIVLGVAAAFVGGMALLVYEINNHPP
jgi:hypothetical protein